MIEGPTDIVVALNVLQACLRDLEKSLARKIQMEVQGFEATTGVRLEHIAVTLIDDHAFGDTRPRTVISGVECRIKL